MWTMSATQTTKTTDLDDFHAKVTRLDARVKDLRHDLDQARQKESDLETQLGSAKAGLATGTGSHTDVMKASKALDEARTGRAHLEEALATVERDHAAADAEHVQRVREQERQRQDQAAKPLILESQDLVQKFIGALATITDTLADRAVIFKRLKAEFPLASTRGAEPASLAALAVDLRAAMRLDDRVAHHEIVGFLRHLFAGPGGRLAPDAETRFHLKF